MTESRLKIANQSTEYDRVLLEWKEHVQANARYQSEQRESIIKTKKETGSWLRHQIKEGPKTYLQQRLSRKPGQGFEQSYLHFINLEKQVSYTGDFSFDGILLSDFFGYIYDKRTPEYRAPLFVDKWVERFPLAVADSVEEALIK